MEANTCRHSVGRLPPTHTSPKAPSAITSRKVRRLWSRISRRWATNSSDRSPPLCSTQPAVVEGGHHGLAGAGGGDHQVAPSVVDLAFDVELVEHRPAGRGRAAPRGRTNEMAGSDRRGHAERLVETGGVAIGIVGLELAVGPVGSKWPRTCRAGEGVSPTRGGRSTPARRPARSGTGWTTDITGVPTGAGGGTAKPWRAGGWCGSRS